MNIRFFNSIFHLMCDLVRENMKIYSRIIDKCMRKKLSLLRQALKIALNGIQAYLFKKKSQYIFSFEEKIT